MLEKQEDIKKLIDYSINFAEAMLKDNQKFYVFSVTIDLNGNRTPTGYYDGDELLSSQDLINKMQTIHDAQLINNEKRAYAITYLVKVKRDNLSDMVDSIAVKIKYFDSKEVTIYYYSYRITPQSTIERLDNWSVIIA